MSDENFDKFVQHIAKLRDAAFVEARSRHEKRLEILRTEHEEKVRKAEESLSREITRAFESFEGRQEVALRFKKEVNSKGKEFPADYSKWYR